MKDLIQQITTAMDDKLTATTDVFQDFLSDPTAANLQAVSFMLTEYKTAFDTIEKQIHILTRFTPNTRIEVS